jgi:hypothetical protein
MPTAHTASLVRFIREFMGIPCLSVWMTGRLVLGWPHRLACGITLLAGVLVGPGLPRK